MRTSFVRRTWHRHDAIIALKTSCAPTRLPALTAGPIPSGIFPPPLTAASIPARVLWRAAIRRIVLPGCSTANIGDGMHHIMPRIQATARDPAEPL